jgi:hypothetical protein
MKTSMETAVCSVKTELAEVKNHTTAVETELARVKEYAMGMEGRLHAAEQSALRQQITSFCSAGHHSLPGITDSYFFWPTIITVSLVAFCYCKEVNPFTVIQSFWNANIGVEEAQTSLIRKPR